MYYVYTTEVRYVTPNEVHVEWIEYGDLYSTLRERVEDDFESALDYAYQRLDSVIEYGDTEFKHQHNTQTGEGLQGDIDACDDESILACLQAILDIYNNKSEFSLATDEELINIVWDIDEDTCILIELYEDIGELPEEYMDLLDLQEGNMNHKQDFLRRAREVLTPVIQWRFRGKATLNIKINYYRHNATPGEPHERLKHHDWGAFTTRDLTPITDTQLVILDDDIGIIPYVYDGMSDLIPHFTDDYEFTTRWVLKEPNQLLVIVEAVWHPTERLLFKYTADIIINTQYK